MVFDTPLIFMGNIWQVSQGIDLKRTGIFPIVQGIRTLALDHQLVNKNTFARIDALIAINALPNVLGRELQEAFSVFHWLRLKGHVAQENLSAQTALRNHVVKLDDLNSLEKNSLRQAFHVVKRFKRHVKMTYQLSGSL